MLYGCFTLAKVCSAFAVHDILCWLLERLTSIAVQQKKWTLAALQQRCVVRTGGLSDGLLYGLLDGSQLLSCKRCLAVRYDGLFGRVHIRWHFKVILWTHRWRIVGDLCDIFCNWIELCNSRLYYTQYALAPALSDMTSLLSCLGQRRFVGV